MGKGIIVKEGLHGDEKVSKQTVASAKDKPVLSDARVIDMDDPFHETNLPRLVDTTTANIPSDLSWGIREVFFKANGTAVLTITGTNISGNASIWVNTVTKNASGAAVYGSWTGTVAAVAFVGATKTANGVAGIVPKPLAADEDMVLMGDGTWGLPDSVVNRINKLQDAVNQIIEALNSSADILNGTSTAALAMDEPSEDEAQPMSEEPNVDNAESSESVEPTEAEE